MIGCLSMIDANPKKQWDSAYMHMRMYIHHIHKRNKLFICTCLSAVNLMSYGRNMTWVG